jgi:hypothetical protein
MSPADINAVQAAELVRRSLQIADRAVVCDIECEALPTTHFSDTGRPWYDVRPMLNEHEHSLPIIDMAREGLDYALMRGLLQRHAEHAHLVRITRRI